MCHALPLHGVWLITPRVQVAEAARIDLQHLRSRSAAAAKAL